MLRVRSGLLERIGLYSAWQSRGRNRHVRTAPSNSPSVSSTGLDASHDRGASLKWLGRCLRRFLSPCSHRETSGYIRRDFLYCLRPLFAQGGPYVKRRGGDYAFDPCSHREARRGEVSQGSRSLRPLFAQGGQPAGCSQTLTMPSTPVRTGRPRCTPLRHQGFPFDPCSHRETEGVAGALAQRDLRPLFAQGDPRTSASGVTRPSSTPVRTGRPRAAGPVPAHGPFDPCSHRET